RRAGGRGPADCGAGRLAFGGGPRRLAVAGESRGDGTGQRADRERLAQQLVAAQVVALTLADVAGDEQHGEVTWTGRFEVADQLGAAHVRHDHLGDAE